MARAQNDNVKQARDATGGVGKHALDEVLHALSAPNHCKQGLRVVSIKGHSSQLHSTYHATRAPHSTRDFALRSRGIPGRSPTETYGSNVLSKIWSSMNDGVLDQNVDAVDPQAPLTNTGSPCRSEGTCIHKPDSTQLITKKNHLREVTRGAKKRACAIGRWTTTSSDCSLAVHVISRQRSACT